MSGPNLSTIERQQDTLQPEHAGAALSASQLLARLLVVQNVMREVMKPDVDFGVIPGTNKPSLYKPGAEKLALTFRLRVPDPTVEEIAETDGGIRLRVRVPILANDGSVLAVGIGECSSNEEKYRWRAAVCNEEFDETPLDQRRGKWKKGQNGGYQIKQIRTQPADQVNTILKMAHKRGYVHGIIMATGAGSIFTQDIEDLPEEVRQPEGDEGQAPPIQAPQRRSAAPAAASSQPAAAPAQAGNGYTAGVISEQQARRLFAIAMNAGWTKDEYRGFIEQKGYKSDREIPSANYNAIVAEIESGAGR